MVTATPGHPDLEQLAAFDLGRLPDAEREAVEEHLLDCDGCLRLLEQVQDDPFVVLVRAAAHESTTNCGGQITPCGPPTAGVVGPAPACVPSAVDEDAVTPAGPLDPWAVLVGHPRYRIHKVLARGGMGVVYLAEHLLMHRHVALKVISNSLLANPTAVARFQREVKAAAQLSHPNIVTSYDAEEFGGLYFLVMEYVEGVSLARLIAAQRWLDVGQACRLAYQVAVGLQYAHDRGMTHRDIKPPNLLVTDAGVVKILDFGLARVAGEGPRAPMLTQAGALMGTPDYMAPEQARSPGETDPRADLYSLGCTLYHMLAGHPPFPGDTIIHKLAGHFVGTPRPLRELRPDVPAGLEAVVQRLLEKDPARRYATAGELAQALAPFVPQGPALTPIVPVPLTPGPDAEADDGPVPPTLGVEAPKEQRPPDSLPISPRRVAAPAAAGGGKKVGRGGRWVAAALLASLAAGLLAAVVVLTVRTDKGELVIEADDPDVEVVVKEGGKRVVVVDNKTKHRVELKAGAYELELTDPKGMKLETNSFTLRRGGKVIVRVYPKPAPTPDATDKKVVADRRPVAEGKAPGGLKELKGEFRVNTTKEGVQGAPQVAIDAKGRYVVVWESQKDGGDWDIYAQRFGADHNPLGREFLVNTTTAGDQRFPYVAMSPGGAFLIAWSKHMKSGGVYAQRYSADGVRVGAEVPVNSDPVSSPQTGSVVAGPGGEYYVAWCSVTGGRWLAYVRRVPASGDKLGSAVCVDSKREAEGGECRAALTARGRLAVAYSLDGNILVQYLSADGTRHGEPVKANAYPHGKRQRPWLTSDAKGGLVVTWGGEGPDDNQGIFARRFSAEGPALSDGEVLVNTVTGDVQANPVVARRDSGDYTIVWTSMAEDGSLNGVFAQAFDPEGRRRGEPLQVNVTSDKHQESPSVAINANGTCVAVWQGNGPGDDVGVFARVFQLSTK